MKYSYTGEEKALLWLDSFETVTHLQKSKILSFVEPLELVRDFTEHEEVLEKIVSAENLTAMRDSLKDGSYLAALLQKLRERDMFFVTCRSADYPALLKEIPAPPVVLYGKGNRELLTTRCFSAVGSRRTLPWAQALSTRFSAALSAHFTLVTGLAEGGDAAVIRGVLDREEEKIPLICVLAYGHDHELNIDGNIFLRRNTGENGF